MRFPAREAQQGFLLSAAKLVAVLDILETNLSRVRSQIESACERSGRDPESVRLLPVTKYVDDQVIAALGELGLRQFAESRAQTLRARASREELAGFEWVMIGHLQTNKAGQVARAATQIQSVDSVRVAQALSRQAEQLEKPLSVYLQVNTSGEAAKHGFAPDDLAAAAETILALPGLRALGLMTMAPHTGSEELVRGAFADLRELRDTVTPQLRELSMGMSGDFQIAIEEGATTVRVGSALFEGLS